MQWILSEPRFLRRSFKSPEGNNLELWQSCASSTRPNCVSLKLSLSPKSYMFDWHIATLRSLRKYIAKCLAELHVQAGVTLARSAADFPDEVGERCVMTVSVPAAIAAGSAAAESWE